RPQRLRVRHSVTARPRLVIESDAVDDQCVALPASDRISHPVWSRVGLQLTAVHMDHAVGEVFAQNRDDSRCLDDAFPAGKSLRLGAVWQTLIERSSPVIFLLTLDDKVADPRLQGVAIGT